MNVRIKRTLIHLVVMVGLALVLQACASSTPTTEPTKTEEPTKVAVQPPTQTPEPPEPTDTAVPPSPTVVPPTETPLPTDTAVPSPTPVPPSPTPVPPEDTATPEPEVDLASATSENCIGCHTSQETLQALAEDKTVKSEATSGEG